LRDEDKEESAKASPGSLLSALIIPATQLFLSCTRSTGLARRRSCPGRRLRVVDESGEDYLYPARNFLMVALPKAVERALLKAS
jgi:hypothetical protein